jgi:uncharacterized protein with NAD-binding domain and iron-sulfur cluster
MNKVFILGGGVAGLSAAHELAERDFEVVLFEQHAIGGGKARSMDNTGSGTGGLKDWPAEHGFRFFPGFYWHLTDTMTRIKVDPINNVTADKNLVAAREIAIGQEAKPLFIIKATHPTTLQEWIGALRQIVEDPSLGIPLQEGRVFLRKLFCFLGAGRARRLEQYETTSWWDFIEADLKSDQYKAILARGLSQSLVAMRPDKASALTVGSMLVQILLNIVRGEHADRVLNAPTNEAWIDPWVKQLSLHPKVSIHFQHTVTGIQFDATKKKVTNVTVTDATGLSTTHGDEQDYYLSALPIDVVKTNSALFPTSFKRAAGLSRPASSGADDGVDKLETEWMSGVLFYMNRDVSAAHGHIIYCHSRWALTSISQRQFWRNDYPWNQRGNGQGRDILSTIISDWDSTGNKVVTLPAKSCTKQQILDETWAQLKTHLSMAGNGTLTDADRIASFLDPAIKFDSSGKVVDNTEQLLVNTKGSRGHRPKAATNVPNFFVASDYVLTETDLACMEAANEAARHAVNAVLQAAGSAKPPCKIQPLDEPEVFKAFQRIDDVEYAVNPAQAPLLCRLMDTLLPLAAPPPPLNSTLLATLILGGLNVVLAAIILYLLLRG